MTLAACLTLGASAQQKVQQYFRVTDSNFNVSDWDDDADRPNSINASKNSFTIGKDFNSVAWNFGGEWWEAGVDMSGFDRLVIRLSSVVGNNLQFRIFYKDANGDLKEYEHPDDIVEFEEEVEYIVDFSEDLYDIEGNVVDLTQVKRFTFWNYWNTNEVKDEDGNKISDDGDPSVTVTIAAMYLERTLADGEKDYVDLLSEGKLTFSDDFLDSDDDETTSASYIDNAGVLHMNENATAGIYYEDTPADWSAYKYLVVVPQTPNGDGDNTIKYVLTDLDDNAFESGSFRYGYWNRPRAAVLNLNDVLTTKLGDSSDDAPEYLDDFDTKSIFSFCFELWGGVSSWQYGIAGLYLSNTAPTYSTGFGEDTDATGDYVRDNASANTISTVCLPYASACCGATVYEPVAVDSRETPTELYAAPHAGILEAGKPYIICSNTARNVTFFRAGAGELGSPVQNGALCAGGFTTYYVEADKNYCVLNADGDTFEAVTGKSKRVNSNTAYIDCNMLPEGGEAENGLVFSISGIDGPLAINKVTLGQQTLKTGIVYDLAGRVVGQPTSKGIYIKDGKKFVVK